MKVFFNRLVRNSPYGGGNQFLHGLSNALIEKGHEVVFNLDDNIDVIFMVDPRHGDLGYTVFKIMEYKQKFPNVKIVHRVNECDKRKNTNNVDEILIKSALVSDEVIFISEWLKSYFQEQGFSKDCHVIYNGCDTSLFNFADSTISTPPSIVTHHWSDNFLKGFDVYKKIDQYLAGFENPPFTFTYVGRYWNGYTPVSTKIIDPCYGVTLANELKKHDIYLTASRWEPCGMHHVEGAACGLPVIYHNDGGGINELCKKHGEGFNTFDELLKNINLIVENYDNYREKINIEELSIIKVCEKYVDIIESF